MSISRVTSCLLAVVLLSATPVFAHHAFSSEFDTNKPAHIVGKVERIEWRNPHVEVVVAVVEKRSTKRWNIELSPPHEMSQYGWNKDTLRPGMTIAADGFLASMRLGTTSLTIKETGQTVAIPISVWGNEMNAGRKGSAPFEVSPLVAPITAVVIWVILAASGMLVIFLAPRPIRIHMQKVRR